MREADSRHVLLRQGLLSVAADAIAFVVSKAVGLDTGTASAGSVLEVDILLALSPPLH
jgi:hypothetical protein